MKKATKDTKLRGSKERVRGKLNKRDWDIHHSMLHLYFLSSQLIRKPRTERVPKAISTKEETIGIELTIKTTKFNIKMLRSTY